MTFTYVPEKHRNADHKFRNLGLFCNVDKYNTDQHNVSRLELKLLLKTHFVMFAFVKKKTLLRICRK